MKTPVRIHTPSPSPTKAAAFRALARLAKRRLKPQTLEQVLLARTLTKAK